MVPGTERDGVEIGDLEPNALAPCPIDMGRLDLARAAGAMSIGADAGTTAQPLEVRRKAATLVGPAAVAAARAGIDARDHDASSR
jgi:hypothetical protein